MTCHGQNLRDALALDPDRKLRDQLRKNSAAIIRRYETREQIRECPTSRGLQPTLEGCGTAD